jgi:hypothetical protein
MNPSLHRGRVAFAAIAVVAIAACSGTAAPPPPKATPAPTPVAVPTSSPVTVVQQQAVVVPAATVGATPEPVALPSAAGFAPTMLLPLPASAVTAQLIVLVSNVAPSAAPPFAVARTTHALRNAEALPAGGALLLYTELFATATLALPTAPGFVIAIPSGDVLPRANYYLALYDPTRPRLAWQYGFEGPAAIAQSTLTFAANPAPLTLGAHLTYAIALYAIPQAGAQPTPAPSIAPIAVPTQTPPALTATPTPPPTPAPTGSAPASPAPGGSISITITVPAAGAIASAPQPLTVASGATLAVGCSEPGYAGPFHPVLDDAALATIVVPTPPPTPVPTATPLPTPSPAPTATPSPLATPTVPATSGPTPAPAMVRFTIVGLTSGGTTLRLRSDNGAVAAYSLTVTP